MDKDKSKKKRSKKRVIVAVAIVLALLTIDLMFTGMLRFGYYVVKCGGLPVKVGWSPYWGGGSWYDRPGNYFPGGVISTEYYCSIEELKTARPSIKEGI